MDGNKVRRAPDTRRDRIALRIGAILYWVVFQLDRIAFRLNKIAERLAP